MPDSYMPSQCKVDIKPPPPSLTNFQGVSDPGWSCIFYSRGQRWYYIMFLNFFKFLNCFFIKIHQRHRSMRSFMTNHCQKYSPLLGLVLQVLLCSSIDPRMKILWMQIIIHDFSGVPCGVLCILVFVSLCGNTQASNTTIEFKCTYDIW